jgi:hypothetical protein
VGKIASLFRADTFQPATATTTTAAIGNRPPGALAEEARGARSILYSVAAYLLSAPDAKMIALVLAQAMAAALTITIVATSLGVIEFWKSTLLAMAVVVATPVACFANSAVPDDPCSISAAPSAIYFTFSNAWWVYDLPIKKQ